MLFKKNKTEASQEKSLTESSISDKEFMPVSSPELANEKASSLPISDKKESDVEEKSSPIPANNIPVLDIPVYLNSEKSDPKVPFTDTGSNDENLDEVSVTAPKSSQNPEAFLPPVSAEVALDFEKNLEITAEELRFLTQLCKYGCLRIPPTGLSANMISILDTVQTQNEEVCFHTPKTLAIYAHYCRVKITDLRKKILFKNAVSVSDIPLLVEQSDILIAWEQTGKSQVWNCLSACNPTKKKMLKISQKGNYGCLTPHLVVVLKGKTGKYGLVFDTISPVCEAFFPGEKTAYYSKMLMAYHTWLNSDELEGWIRRKKLFVAPTHIGVAILLNTNQDDMIGDLLEICENLGITTPIYFIDKPTFLAKPFAWYSHVDQEKYPQFLTIRNHK